MELPEFLRARLDEMERVAQGAARTDDGRGGEWTPIGLQSVDDARVDDHIALNDPAYVLADVAAKRRIVDEFGDAGEWLPPNPDDDEPEYSYGHARALYDVIKLLAAPHDGHPDFDPAWKVG